MTAIDVDNIPEMFINCEIILHSNSEGEKVMNGKFVDLSNYYNSSLDDEIHHKPGNDLKSVPHGISEFAGTLFNVNGIIQLSGSISKEKTGNDYPAKVTGIAVNQIGERLHFLHCASWHEKSGTKIGEYRIQYANDVTITIPIVYGEHAIDWWVLPGDASPTAVLVAWKGDNERTRNLGYSLQFYKYTWINPYPAVEITALDFISDGKESAPFLMAVTVE
jgi:hypothetical protein